MPHQSTLPTSTVESTPTPVSARPVPVVLIPLRGKHGEGRAVVVEAADYERLCALGVGPLSLVPNGKGRTYVASRRGIGRPHPNEMLARWVVGACRGEVVTYIDGNPLNLRRSNLEVLRGEALARWRQRHSVPGRNTVDITPTERLLRDAGRIARRAGVPCLG